MRLVGPPLYIDRRNVDKINIVNLWGDWHVGGMTTPTTPSESATPLTVPPGLKGLPVAETTIGSVRGAEGFFHYRQYDATDIARRHSLEEAWSLLVDGSLPDADGLATLQASIDDSIDACLDLGDAVRVVAATDAPPHAALTALLPLLGSFAPTIDIDHEERRANVLHVAATVPGLLAAVHRVRQGLEPLASDPTLSYAGNWLYRLTGARPTEVQARAVEQYLIATMDHGFNNSTFATRVITSSGADVVAALVGGISALSGPLHGGAPSRAIAMIDEIGDPENTEAWITARLAAGDKIMGFGHAVYRADDPRSILLRETAEQFGGELVERAIEIESRILAVLRAHKPEATIVTNVEYYASLVLQLSGLTPDLFTPTFTVSRIIGWSAHVLEQAANNKIIRPSASYVGPPPQPLATV